MYEMGKLLNITKQSMKIMIDEIDVDGDETITIEEWINYISDCQKSKDKDMTSRKNNFLVDLVNEKTNSNVTDRYNVNIYDEYKLNDVELRYAIDVADKVNKRDRRSSRIDMEQINNIYEKAKKEADR